MSLRKVFQKVWASYSRLLNEHFYLMQSTQTSILLGTGDFIAQTFIDSDKKHYDYIRTFRFAILGFPLGAGLMTWYKVLDRFVGKDTGIKSSLKKVALDQLIFSPVMLVIFMSSLTTLEGGNLQTIKERLKKSYKDIMITNYQFWPIIQIANFSLVPLQFRVLVVQIAALAWNTYLAWELNSPLRKKHTIPEKSVDKK